MTKGMKSDLIVNENELVDALRQEFKLGVVLVRE
jgi:hypothetical protein